MTKAQKADRRAAALKAWETMRANRKAGITSSKPKKDISALETKYKAQQNKTARSVKLPKPKPASADEMLARAVALVLTFHGIGNRRKLEATDISVHSMNTEAAKKYVSASEKLIDAEELESIQSLDGECRRYVETRALPITLKKGIYLLPDALVEEMRIKLDEFATQRRDRVHKLLAVYDERVAQARAEKGTNQKYLTKPEVERRFSLHYQILEFDTPVKLQKLNPALYENERRKAEAQWQETRETIQAMLRAEFAEMVSHLVDKLTTDDQGKQKTFRDSSLDKFSDFLNTFNPRNIHNDVQMKTLVDQAKALMNGMDTDLLRNSDTTRDYVRGGFSQIKKAIEPMLVERPGREITFED